MLEEYRLQLERTDLVVAGLEHIVGTADVGDVPVGVDAGHVTRVVVTPGHRLRVALGIVPVPGHQRQRLAREVQADLALARLCQPAPAGRVHQHHWNAWKGPAHRPRAHLGTGGVAHLGGGLGLPESVADDQSPCPPDLLDHLRVERLTGTDRLPQGAGALTEVGVDQHPPYRRRRTERGHPPLAQVL